MIFLANSNSKEIELPKDPTYDELERYSREVYQQGRADLLKNIRECAEHLGYDDIEDLLSYVELKEQKNE